MPLKGSLVLHASSVVATASLVLALLRCARVCHLPSRLGALAIGDWRLAIRDSRFAIGDWRDWRLALSILVVRRLCCLCSLFAISRATATTNKGFVCWGTFLFVSCVGIIQILVVGCL